MTVGSPVRSAAATSSARNGPLSCAAGSRAQHPPDPLAELGRRLAGEREPEHAGAARPARWRPATRPAGPSSGSCPTRHRRRRRAAAAAPRSPPACSAVGGWSSPSRWASSAGVSSTRRRAAPPRRTGDTCPAPVRHGCAAGAHASPSGRRPAPGSWCAPGSSCSSGCRPPGTPSPAIPSATSSDQPAGPAGVVAVGQRLLALLGVVLGRPPCRPARARPRRSRPSPVANAPVLDRELVGGELAVLGQLVGWAPCCAPVLRSTTTARPWSSRSIRSTRPPSRARPTSAAKSSSVATTSRRLSASHRASRRDHARGLLALLARRPSRCRGRRSAAGARSRAGSASSVLRSGVGAPPRRTACTRVPTLCAAPAVSPPPTCSRNQRSSQRRNDSTLDGLTATGSSLGAHRTVVGQRRQAPPRRRVGAARAGGGQRGEPVRRGRAQLGRRRRRRRRVCAQLGHQAGRATAGGATGGQRPRSSSAGAAGRSRRGTGTALSPSRSLVTAVTSSAAAGPGHGDVEQPALLVQQPAERRRRRRPSAASGSAPGRSRSTSRSEPRNEPRIRRSGQTPSWTPATHTTSHSSPLLACAVSTCTASPATGARAASVVSRDLLARAGGRGTPRARHPGSRSQNRAAVSNSATTASRSRSAASPAWPPSRLARSHRSASPVRCQTSHSTSSAVAPGAATRLAGDGEQRPRPRAAGRAADRVEGDAGRRVVERLDEQRAGRAAAARGELRAAQRLPQPAQPHHVGAAHRRGEQLDARRPRRGSRAGSRSAAAAAAAAPRAPAAAAPRRRRPRPARRRRPWRDAARASRARWSGPARPSATRARRRRGGRAAAGPRRGPPPASRTGAATRSARPAAARQPRIRSRCSPRAAEAAGDPSAGGEQPGPDRAAGAERRPPAPPRRRAVRKVSRKPRMPATSAPRKP